MPSGYDELSYRSFPGYPGGTFRQCRFREAMESAGFTVNVAEWWHFDFRGWADHPILDWTFPRSAGVWGRVNARRAAPSR